MNTIRLLFSGIIVLVMATFTEQAKAQPAVRVNVNFNTFYNELGAYGKWMRMPRYGDVWVYAEPGFRPYYSNGQWEFTDDGWYWSSGYPWGWAPFHYGRWEYDPRIGWFWIPGYDYAPAWVVWSQANDYYGWAPLGFGWDLNISFGRIPIDRWHYAPRAYISYRGIDRYCVPYRDNRKYYRRQQPIVNVYVRNSIRYDAGPRGYSRDQSGNVRGSGSRPDIRNRAQDNNVRPGNAARPEVRNRNNGETGLRRPVPQNNTIREKNPGGNGDARVQRITSPEMQNRIGNGNIRQAPKRNPESARPAPQINNSQRAPSAGRKPMAAPRPERRITESAGRPSASPKKVSPGSRPSERARSLPEFRQRAER